MESSKGKYFFLFSFLAVITGFFLSMYSLYHHLAIQAKQNLGTFSCNVNDTMSCDKVALSPYSEVLGTPLGVWGIGFFLVLFLALLGSKKFSSPLKEAFLKIFSLFVLVGCVCSLVLAYISLSVVGSVCLVCLGVYLCNFVLAGLLLSVKGEIKKKKVSAQESGKVFLASLVVLGVVVGGFQFFQGQKARKVPLASEEKLPEAGKKGFKPIPKTLVARPGSPSNAISLSTSPYMGKGEDYRLGNDEAPIVIHEFVDFECPACSMASKALKQLKQEFPELVLLVFRNYPLDKSCNDNIKREFHENSCTLAKLARCAGRKGKFWEYHDLAFAGQKEASTEKASEWAVSLGLSQFEVNNCLQDKNILAKIRDDISQGDKLGVEGTPAIYVNGKKFEGNFQALKNFVRAQAKTL